MRVAYFEAGSLTVTEAHGDTQRRIAESALED